MNNYEVGPESLRKFYSLDDFPWNTTKDIPQTREIVGQERGVNSILFGLNMNSAGYNIYVTGMRNTGRRTSVNEILQKVASKRRVPDDWFCIYNFQDPDRPGVIHLPPGQGKVFREDMRHLIYHLRIDLPKRFQSEEYDKQKKAITKRFTDQKKELFSRLEKKARENRLGIARTTLGFSPVPLKEDGTPLSKEEYQGLSEEEKKKIESKISILQEEIQKAFQQIELLERESQEKLDEFNKKLASSIVESRIRILRDKYEPFPDLLEYLTEVKGDVTQNIDIFLDKEKKKTLSLETRLSASSPFTKYQVNVIIDNSGLKHAPVIEQNNPTYNNMFGTIERVAHLGGYITDFTRIKTGSVARANGGYLVVDALKVLTNPFVWDALKRTLREKRVRTEDITQQYGFISTTGLRPNPIPLDIKVVMVGSATIFELLHLHDEDFQKIFKVRADFDYESSINEDNIRKCTQFICKICNEEKLPHCDKSGMSAILGYSSRLAENQEKLSLQFGKIADLLREASFFAQKDHHPYISSHYVEKAVEEQEYRSSLLKDKVQEMIERNFILIDVKGEKVGQVNGLSIYNYGNFMFGKPTRVTAQTFMGDKGVVHIDRDVKLSGKTHNKGVMIISGYLGGKFGTHIPLALSASLTFEQSYSYVEGDSASSTELLAILSSLANVPVKQGIAVTGSVNQKGEIQPIGGVNKKIEGFFEVCQAKGLTGEQGVIIPKSNLKNLMLKNEIIEAVKEGKFHLWAISTIDQGIEILTGVPVRERQKDGSFPKGTINRRVEDQLRYLLVEAEKIKEQIKTLVKK